MKNEGEQLGRKRIKIGLMLLGAALVIAAVIIFLPRLLHLAGYILWLFSPFLAAYAVSLLVNPMADGLQKRFHLPRGVSAVLVIVLTVGVLGGILTGVVWKIVDEIRGIYDDFPVIYENIRTAWRASRCRLVHTSSSWTLCGKQASSLMTIGITMYSPARAVRSRLVLFLRTMPRPAPST